MLEKQYFIPEEAPSGKIDRREQQRDSHEEQKRHGRRKIGDDREIFIW